MTARRRGRRRAARARRRPRGPRHPATRRRPRWRRPRPGRRRAPARRWRRRAGGARAARPAATSRIADRASAGRRGGERAGVASGRASAARRREVVGDVGRAGSAWRASTGHEVAPGDVGEQRAAPRGAPGCGGTRGRRWWGRRPGARPERRAQRRAVSARRRARIGWRGPGRMPARPSRPGAAQQVDQHRLGLVVGGVAEARRRARGRAWRAARARASRLGPGSTATALGPEGGAERSAARPHDVGLGRRAGAQAVVDVDGGDLAARRRRPARAGPASRRRPTRRTTTGVPGGREGAAREQLGRRHDRHDGRGLSRRRGARRPPARSSGAGSRISSDGWAGCPGASHARSSSVVPPARPRPRR